MHVPISWLADWVPIGWEPRDLASRITMAGLEVEGIESAAPPFNGVIVAEILEASKHPQADKLQVCRVSTGSGEPVQIVCGAPNARAGLKSALAIVGAKLPGGLDIKAARLRGVESQGMLASAKELGLAETSSGILELPADAPVGKPLREYLSLDDTVLAFKITANRGDAMSVIGVARDVAALGGKAVAGPKIAPVPKQIDDVIPVGLEAPDGCARFVGRIIRGLDNRRQSPLWLRERLRRAGLRSISPLVDVTNYVMLELGQPMHAYDLAKLRGGVRARWAKAGEKTTLLDGRNVELQSDVLVIADDESAVGVAGVMGGQRTAIGEGTTDLFLESAFFAPDAIRGRGRRLNVVTDAGQRFERGVDPAHQQRAMERATALIVAIAGGKPGPIIVSESVNHLPKRPPVSLRRTQLARLLGAEFERTRVTQTLTALQMQVAETPDGWTVTPPSHRFDIAIEADLIEEVARIVGFDAIPEKDAPVAQRFSELPEERPAERIALDTLAARGYHEAITYAFVDPALQKQLFPEREGLALTNPISADLSVMRLSLWPGLLRAVRENQRRQQDRVRLFEHGTRFDYAGGVLTEIDTLSGAALGPRLPEQWGVSKENRGPVDFFDVKADVEALIAATGSVDRFQFDRATLSCLHPGRSARILRGTAAVGWIGELHPSLVRGLELNAAPILFELDFEAALGVSRPSYVEVSRFPAVRRDLAVVVDEGLPLRALRERVTLAASSLLRGFRVFDVYRGPGVETGRKSVALGLIFQDISRTLTDEDADQAVASIVAELRASLNAKIRE
jgi:phenylalanyl-tRNA synthetase beta chain